MNSAVLRGREHVVVGGIAAVAEGPAAIALSRGGAAKRYPHKDPNEDFAGFAAGPGGLLLVVADGHSGHEASERAVERLLERWASDWAGPEAPGLRERWREVSLAALFDACHAVRERALREGCQAARTTLSAALLRPAEGWLGWLAIGDSHVFAVEECEALELGLSGEARKWFLGHPAETRESLAQKYESGTRELDGLCAVALATDGLSERGIGVESPSRAVALAATSARARVGDTRERLPLETARDIVETALRAHRQNAAGDNVAAAVGWIERAGPAG